MSHDDMSKTVCHLLIGHGFAMLQEGAVMLWQCFRYGINGIIGAPSLCNCPFDDNTNALFDAPSGFLLFHIGERVAEWSKAADC